MWNYELAGKVLYEFFYGEFLIDDYDEVIDSLVYFIELASPYNFKSSSLLSAEYKKIRIQDHIEQFKNILRVEENSESLLETNLDDMILDMFIYNDGEVHFNDSICLPADAIYQPLDADELTDLVSIPKINLYAGCKKLKYDKLIISPDFICTGYGKEKIHILPGDWLIVKGTQIYPCNFESAFKSEIHGFKFTASGYKYPIYPETLFKREVIEAAAKWWAGFLPGISEDCVTHLPHESKIVKYDRASLIPVTDFQYQTFVRTLVNEIYFCSPEHWTSKIFTIKLGHRGSGGHPDIIEKTLIKSGIRIESGLPIFPYGSEMDIFSNGLINFNETVIYTHPDLNLYSYENLNLENASLMIFKGGDCKALKIETQKLKGNLHCFSIIHGTQEIMDDSKILFVKLTDTYLKSDKKLKDYTDTELIEILQNPQIMIETFHKWCISYDHSLRSALKPPVSSLGDLKLHPIGDGWYQYHTKPARVVMVTKDGVINVQGPIAVAQGDFLLTYDIDHSLYSYLATSEPGYAGYLCDEKGNILDYTPHIPGHPEIPLLGFGGFDAA